MSNLSRVQALTNTTVNTYTFENGVTSTFTENSNLGIRIVECDQDGDGSTDTVSQFYTDNDGNTIMGQYDFDGDGNFDSASLFQHDENGQLSMRFDDLDGDGNFDTFTTFSLDENENIAQGETIELTDGWLKMAANHKVSSLLELFGKKLNNAEKREIMRNY